MQSLSIRLDPQELLSGWRAETGRLLLPAAAVPRLQEKVAVRVRLAGHVGAVTVVGTVVSAHRHGARHRLELAPDPASLCAVQLLAAAARGDVPRLPQRPPRYLARLPVRVALGGRDLFMITSCISEGGCALRWSGPLPPVGEALRLRIGAGARSADLSGVVCWRTPPGAGATAGVRFVGSAGAASGWRALVAEAEAAGAPQA